jgi:hypothetical protein
MLIKTIGQVSFYFWTLIVKQKNYTNVVSHEIKSFNIEENDNENNSMMMHLKWNKIIH